MTQEELKGLREQLDTYGKLHGEDVRRLLDCVERRKTTVSIMKACEVARVSRRTIYNWMADGKIEFVRTAGGSVRIFEDTLLVKHAKNTPLTNG